MGKPVLLAKWKSQELVTLIKLSPGCLFMDYQLRRELNGLRKLELRAACLIDQSIRNDPLLAFSMRNYDSQDSDLHATRQE